jgi:predicted GTPase
MPKKVKEAKKRSYRITDLGGRPCLKMNGDFLATEYGFETGSRVEVTKHGNVIMITKIDQATVDYQEAQKRRDSMKKEMKEVSEKLHLWDSAKKNHGLRNRHQKQATALMVAESQGPPYSVDEELTSHPERYLQD